MSTINEGQFFERLTHPTSLGSCPGNRFRAHRRGAVTDILIAIDETIFTDVEISTCLARHPLTITINSGSRGVPDRPVLMPWLQQRTELQCALVLVFHTDFRLRAKYF